MPAPPPPGLIRLQDGLHRAAVAATSATSLTFAPPLAVAGLGMGAIFAPLATMGVRAAPPALAGAASGVLNTGRQLGATLGGAITGAVLASQLATNMHARAALLPAPGRRLFVTGFSAAARPGLQVGLTAVRAGEPGHLIHDVFARACIAAMRPALAISVALLIAGALACLLLRRSPAPAVMTAPAGEPARTPVSA